MKKFRILFLLCMAFTLCTFFITGCGNDDNDGSGGSTARTEQSSGSGNNGTSGDNGTSGNNGGTSGNDKENGGLLDDVGDEIKTLADDAETMLNDIVD